MPPFDPVEVSPFNNSMDPHLNQQQQQQPPHNNPNMYATYAAYAPPAYHGHTGYTQTFAAPPPPQGWGWGAPQQPPQAYGAPPQQQPAPVPAPAPTTTNNFQIMMPHENDVLMGRGGKNNQHMGNERLRDMARSVRDRYKASAKKGKSNMSRELVQKVRELDPPGRFLKRNPITSEWEDVGDETAREKVSQVLRDAVSEWTGPKAQAKEAREQKDGTPITEPIKEEDKRTESTSSPSTSRAASPNRSRTADPAPSPAPMPSIEVPSSMTLTARTVTETAPSPTIEQPPAMTITTTPSPLPSSSDDDVMPLRSRADTADSEFSLDDISIASSVEDLDLSSDSSSNASTTPTSTTPTSSSNKRQFRRMPMPVAHVPFQSFRNKRKPHLLDRYSNLNVGVSSSDMSISSMGSQLSSRNLETQLSSKQLMSSGARQMSSRQLSSRTLSSRQLSSRQLSSRQLSSRQLSSRQLSSRQLSSRGLISQSQRRLYLDMMGDSNLSLESLSICGDNSRQLSRKNLMMEQYVAMDMGLSDFSLGSLPETDVAQPIRVGGQHHNMRPSVIIEGDLEELSEHEDSFVSLNAKPEELMDLYNSVGVGTSISNMTMNTIGTFSGHSRGLYAATGHSMRLESGHSFLQNANGNDLQLDMLDDELFDELDMLDDADEFSSEFI